MSNENPKGIGIIGAIIYGIFLFLKTAVLFVITHIWWFAGILTIGLVTFAMFSYHRRTDAEKRRIRRFIYKHRKLPLYLIGGVIIFLIFQLSFKQTVLVLAGIVVLYFVFGLIIRKTHGCKVCDASGRLSGYNPHLDLEFERDLCYACSGKEVVFKDKSEWYDIALKARKEIIRLQQEQGRLENQFRLYSRQMRISKNANERILRNRDEQQRKQFEEYRKLVESKIIHYQQIEKNAHIFMHSYHIYNQQLKWDKSLEDRGDKNIESSEMALCASDETELTRKYSIELRGLETLMETEVHTNIAEELRLDIEKATEKLKVLLEEPA